MAEKNPTTKELQATIDLMEESMIDTIEDVRIELQNDIEDVCDDVVDLEEYTSDLSDKIVNLENEIKRLDTEIIDVNETVDIHYRRLNLHSERISELNSADYWTWVSVGICIALSIASIILSVVSNKG